MASRIVLNLRAQRRDDGELSNPVTSVGSSDYPASFAGRPRRSSHLTVNGGSQDPRCKASVQGGQFVPRSFGSMPSRDRWGSHDNVDIEDARGMTKGKIEEYELQSGGRMPVRINVDVEVDVEVEVVLDTEGDSDGTATITVTPSASYSIWVSAGSLRIYGTELFVDVPECVLGGMDSTLDPGSSSGISYSNTTKIATKTSSVGLVD
ncbi:hypothetical protein FRB97_000445 [Tulasnella sp. 331]|nr:hypothetical protein FRB97_000445 [Tulasnella sp. 331]